MDQPRKKAKLPESTTTLFLQHGQQVDKIVEGWYDKEDFANQDDLVPPLIAVEKADGLDAVPRSNATAGKLRHGRHHREEVCLRVVDRKLEDESAGSIIRPGVNSPNIF